MDKICSDEQLFNHLTKIKSPDQRQVFGQGQYFGTRETMKYNNHTKVITPETLDLLKLINLRNSESNVLDDSKNKRHLMAHSNYNETTKRQLGPILSFGLTGKPSMPSKNSISSRRS